MPPYLIAPDTITRSILMTDTLTEGATQYIEFQYKSIDSLVKQIVVDTLGLDSTYWRLDDSLSLSPINQDNNIILGSFSGNTSLTGSYNFFAGSQLGQGLTSGSYNSIFGSDNYNNLSTQKYNTLFGSGNFPNITSGQFNVISGQNNGVNLTSANYTTILGFENILTGSGTIYGSFINGINNLNLATNINSSFVNGTTNAQNASTNFQQNFINGQTNLINAQDIRFVFANGSTNGNGNNAPYTSWYAFFNGNNNSTLANPSYAFFNGFGNGATTTNVSYSFFNGFNNATSVTSDMTHSFFSGDRNLFSATLSAGHTFMSGFQNAYNATGADFTTAIGYRNLYTSNSDIQYALAIGRENGYTTTAAHTGSIYLGFRNAYLGGGLYVNYQGWENGYHNTGNYNIGFGFQSLYGQAGLSTGSQNIALGRQSLYSLTTGSNNIAIASYRAGFSHTTGGHNIYLGQESGYSNQAGNYNNFQGYQSGYNQKGSDNIGIGFFALQGNTGLSTGSKNLAIGSQALRELQTGSENIAFGTNALINVTNGIGNIGIGNATGLGVTTGNYNTFIGYQAGYNETGSNKLYIENSNISTPLIYGEFDNDLVRINGSLQVSNKTGTAGNFAAFDGDKIVDSGVSTLGDPDQTLSFSDPNLTISGSGNTIDISGVNHWTLDGTGSLLGVDLVNVGIGTYSPAYGLDVQETARFTASVIDGNNSLGGTGKIMTSNANKLLWEDPSFIGLSEFSNDAGFLTSEVDGSTTNELQNLSLSTATLSITSGNSVNLPMYDAGTYVRPSTSTDGVWIPDGLLDKDLQYGTSGQVLSSTGTEEVDWITIPTSPWTDAGTFLRPSTLSDDIYITDGLLDDSGSAGASGDILTSTGSVTDWVSPSSISENDFDNDMPTGKASKGTNTTISVSGTVLSLSSLDINSPSGWSIGTSTNLEVPDNGLYLVVVNFAKENANCTSMTAVLRSDATTLYTWYPADYNNEIGFSASTIESLTSSSSLNVRVTSTTSGCNVFNYEISATKLSD